MIVLDTHVLIWLFEGERKVGRRAKALIDRFWPAGKVAASAMSFWETALLAARGRTVLNVDPDEWRQRMLTAGLVELPVNGSIAIRATQLVGLPDDPVDRLIAATALNHHAALVTADERILDWRHSLERHDART